MSTIIISLASHGSVPTGIVVLFFSSHSPFTIAGLNRDHRSKSLPHFLFEMLVRNPEGIQMAHETSFPSAYSSSLGVLTYFPFESFQALAERSPTGTGVTVPNADKQI